MNSTYKINATPPLLDVSQKIFGALGGIGLLMLFASFSSFAQLNAVPYISASIVLMAVGILGYSMRAYLTKHEGIKNDGIWHNSLTNRGIWAWIWGIVITGFYVLLYFYPSSLGLGADGGANRGLISLFDPFSQFLKGQNASQWFVYGALYTFAICFFGIRYIFKYRHNKYQIVRTISVMFFQLSFAFFLPEFMQKLNYPYNDFKNMWPLNYYFFDDYNIKGFLSSGNLGMFMLVFGLLMVFVISPILTYHYGKRWYCSWVCGCGGLAETAGDPWRQLSDKSVKAWNIERWLIHSILLFSIVMTVGVIYSLLYDNPGFSIRPIHFTILLVVANGVFWYIKLKTKLFKTFAAKALKIFGITLGLAGALSLLALMINGRSVFFIDSGSLRYVYGFLIGSIFSGVIGVGFYPLMGSRVWCRFGCPMAAILGIQQRFFSKFRITTNGGQCISCGNCSTYCEMGIDVRAYAQRGENIVRASCVGCGVCSAVCPRGVLRLENGSADVLDRWKKELTSLN